MMFPNEKIIFEVPIYSMPQELFHEKWDKWKQDWYIRAEEMGYNPERVKETVKIIMEGKYPGNVWKYNQIVGYVEIKISPRDVVFNVQKTLDTRLRAISKTKHFIQDMYTNGMHFPIGDMCNEELVSEIDSYLFDIQKGLQGNMCLYLETYNAVKKYIDFKGIQNNQISEQNEDM